MKINIPVIPIKKGLLYFLIIGLFSSNVQALISFKQFEQCLANKKTTLALAAGVSVSVAWAVYERMNKSKLKLQNNKLEEEISTYKSDENIKEFLVKAADFGISWQNFLEPANTYLKNSSKSEAELGQDIVNYVYAHIKKIGLRTPDEYHNGLNKGMLDLANKLNELTVRSHEWESKPELKTKAVALISIFKVILNDLKQYKSLFEAHKDYLKLLYFLDEGIEQEYAQEIEYAYAEIANWSGIIDQIVKSKNNQALFPYLFYAQNLTFKLNELEKYLHNLSHFKAYPFQAKHIERAQYIYDGLQVILKHVASSAILMREKSDKVEHDRKEQYMQTEIAERKAKMVQEQAVAEAKLLDQRNRERQLSNERARIEQEKRDIEYKSKENALQLARIHEGRGIQEALADNNSKWHRDQNNLISNYQRDIQQKDAEIKKLKNKLSALEADIRVNHNNGDLGRKARNLEIKISNANNALYLLKNKVNNVPFNPQIVDGLSEYINNLKREVRQLETLLS